MNLVWPGPEYLPGYLEALQQGWSPDNVRGKAAADGLIDREAKDKPIELSDGSTFARLPGFTRWLWDGEFCGAIGFRWQPGTEALPPHCLGHIGYAVVPWKQGRGCATLALRQLLPAAAAEGLRYVEITTDPENMASQRVIVANGGTLVERFMKPKQHAGSAGLRYRIALT
jgi:predicted acetyltransferase